MLKIRKTTPADLPRVMAIYAHARSFMAAHDNPHQWGDRNWPPEELIREDIRKGCSYVCVRNPSEVHTEAAKADVECAPDAADGEVVGTFYFQYGDDIDPTYRVIEDGAWTCDGPYGVVHRIAADGSEKGIGSFCVNWAYSQCHHLRIDTHGDNYVMQGMLRKQGFVHCGTIFVYEEHDPRLAFEKCEGKMQYKTIAGIRKSLSALTYGTPGSAFGGYEEDAFRSYDLAWDAGFRTFDTAHSYGAGEEILGKWLASRGHRNDAVILDKGCNPGQKGSNDIFSAETIRTQLEESLRKLQPDHVELYILHRDDPSVPVDAIVEELNRLQKEGRILAFGGSNWRFDRVLAANAYAEVHGLVGFAAVSPAYSLLDYEHDPWGGSVSLAGDAQKDYRAWLQQTQLPVFNYSSLGRGYLSGKFRTDGGKPIEECLHPAPIMEYDGPVNRARLARAEQLAQEKDCTVSQIGLAWLFAQPLNLFPLVSPSSEAHIRDNVEALNIHLTEEERSWLLNGGSDEVRK